MNTAYCPNAYWMRGAMPSTEAMRDEYIGSVYGAAALGLITTMATLDALDMMEERTPQLIKGRLKHYVADITGRTGSPGHAERVTRAINAMLRHRQDTAWMADFGNAANEAVAPQLMRFRNAMANCFGRHKAVPDPNVCAAVVLAQSLAHEAAAYVERRAQKLTGATVEMPDGCRRNVAWVLRTMSCRPIDHALKEIAGMLLRPNLPPGFDLLADPSVKTGCRAVLNTLASVDTWLYAREKADRLNMRNE